MRSAVIYSAVLGLMATLPPAFAHMGSHEESGNASEHQRLGVQVSQINVLQVDKNPQWAQTMAVINKTAIEKPATSPISMQLLNGKIVPSSNPKLKQADLLQPVNTVSNQFAQNQ